jgi:hypothetical protein
MPFRPEDAQDERQGELAESLRDVLRIAESRDARPNPHP